MQLSIEMPNAFVALETPQRVAQDMKQSYALMLFKKQRVSLAKAADLAGMNIYAFMQLCKDNEVSVADESMDLSAELAGL
jgi:predicted HTH domain antitoxin